MGVKMSEKTTMEGESVEITFYNHTVPGVDHSKMSHLFFKEPGGCLIMYLLFLFLRTHILSIYRTFRGPRHLQIPDVFWLKSVQRFYFCILGKHRLLKSAYFPVQQFVFPGTQLFGAILLIASKSEFYQGEQACH